MTSLQKQLAAIAATSTHQLDLKAQKLAHGKSLLFEPRIAASQTFENIYLICYEGFRDLCALDPRFVQFSRNLFSEQSKVEDRTQMTQQENEKLDEVLETFITMVGPRLLLKPAEKALDWLVRRFRIHEYNTESLVMTYLPYHDTPQFLALLSILPSNPKPAWRFLHPYIQPPTNPPRRVIVYTATNTPTFFEALQNYIMRVLKAGHQGPSLLTFWSSVTTQAIDGILDHTTGRKEVQDQRTEGLLLRVLRVLNVCMRGSNGTDAVIACYMIVIVLVTKSSLEDKVLNSIMEAVTLSRDDDTSDACLMCLAVIAEERTHVQLPVPVAKRLSKTPDLARTLISLSRQCRVDRLALGCALASLDGIAESDEKQQSFKNIIEANLLDDPQLSVALSGLLQIAQNSERSSPQHTQLIDFASTLSENSSTARVINKVAQQHAIDLESLGLIVGSSLTVDESADIEDEDEDEDMLDAEDDEHTDASLILPPEISEASFLSVQSAQSFRGTLSLFERAVALNRTKHFLGAPALQRKSAFSKPLFFSFLARVWCSSASVKARAAALRAAISLIREEQKPINLQHMVPYLLFALADPSAIIRRSAAACASALSTSKPASKVWASSDLYGTAFPKSAQLSAEQLSEFLTAYLVPVLEECAMDANFLITSAEEALEGSHSKIGKRGLKSATRSPVAAFLATHTASSPLLDLRLRLLPLFHSSAKAYTGLRKDTLLPMLRAWSSSSEVDLAKHLQGNPDEFADADRAHLAALLPREHESVQLAQDIISGRTNKERTRLVERAFDWLNANFGKMKAEARLEVGQRLLELSLQENETGFEALSRGRALETLRNVRLDTETLVIFIESVPSSLQLAEGPPTKKRRRTSRNEMARAEFQTPDDISRVLRRLTLVLELIESSSPVEHTALFKNLFTVLDDLQQLKQQSGSDLVYLQSLIFSSLTPMVNRLKEEENSSQAQAAVRADILIDCIRHSTSPQVQNAALLLIGSLASWVPEMILHNLMPIFTFIGSSLLRQQDDYSAHVVDQTISRVVPQLASSLRSKHKNFLIGVADLLLSFTAAFEHIPSHRRLKLFSELARTLGPNDSLPAIVALLVDRYPNNKIQRRFSTDLIMSFEPLTALETFKGYLNLIEEAAGTKHQRKISETLFSFNDKSPTDIEQTLNNLLASFADLVSEERLKSHATRAFTRSRDPAVPRTVFASVVETVIRISKYVKHQPKLYHSCSRVLGKCLDLLPTPDLIKSTELLLAKQDREVQIAAIKSVEVRASTVFQNDKSSVSSLLEFLPHLDGLLQQAGDADVKRIAISCIDSIVGRFGKRDTSTVAAVAETVAGSQALSNNDDQTRILSLLCLTSMIDVLEDEAISLLPTILPVAFEYLGAAIEEENTSLHNAVYTMLANIVQRLGFIFSGDYLIPVLKLSQQSAAGDLGEECDEERRQFFEKLSQHLEAQEVFSAIKSTWADGLQQGPEAVEEELKLMRATIEIRTKPQLVKASSTLFGLLLHMFKLRDSVADNEDYEDEEVEQLEENLVETVIAMTLKLNDQTFRPFFAQLVDQAASSSTTFYKFAAAFFDKFKGIATQYSSYIIDCASKLLTSLVQDEEESELRTAVLRALQRTFEHDQEGFWQAPDHFGAIMEPLLAQLTISATGQITTDVIPTITELASSSSSSTDNHREMNTVLLKYMRAEEAHTRLATIKCEQALTERLGEEWLGLLPEMLPFISEAREDDDEMVERETQRWISKIEEKLGEDLDALLQ
ncbi:snoRNA-binding rRNA-processing protein utp10 [Didymosphaeria variabile]|uniref:U3 small nucleolar RNA-associated protein 10 n=1 Tax=Didymosphaeria variabile TaxID=1932322 RepID=A0A9W9CG60_9PLEO|nr:snoRNA-binding rRNA-processing protein utp10 [Didymosphaeria variabile]KAJ4360215.1 snoRNA-binding rRNA-processing protein utp10 [Didymosphaeria variabile]